MLNNCKECNIFKAWRYINDNRHSYDLDSKCGRCIALFCVGYVEKMIKIGNIPASLPNSFTAHRDEKIKKGK